jgi:hypothetical protein
MSDLEHWSSDGATESEVELLAAARGERQSSSARRRIAAAIGLGSAVAQGGGAAAAGSAATAAAKGAVVGTLAVGKVVAIWGVVGMVGALALRRVVADHPTSTPGMPAAALSSRPEPDRPSAAPQTVNEVRPMPAPLSSSSVPPSLSSFAAVARSHDRPSTSSAWSPVVSSPAATSLQSELVLLERARASLEARRSTDALATLDQYERFHAGGALAVEARVMRIEALLVAGRKDEARAGARAFLTAFPHAMQVKHVASMLAEIDVQP